MCLSFKYKCLLHGCGGIGDSFGLRDYCFCPDSGSVAVLVVLYVEGGGAPFCCIPMALPGLQGFIIIKYTDSLCILE